MKNKKIVSYTSEELSNIRDESDWQRASNMTDEEIEAADRQDIDMKGIDDSWFNNAVLVTREKQGIYIKFDKDIIKYYKKYGRGYQTRMNIVLRAYMEAHPKL
jgi:uncharacterized protein (DUF4415 family)